MQEIGQALIWIGLVVAACAIARFIYIEVHARALEREMEKHRREMIEELEVVRRSI